MQIPEILSVYIDPVCKYPYIKNNIAYITSGSTQNSIEIFFYKYYQQEVRKEKLKKLYSLNDQRNEIFNRK